MTADNKPIIIALDFPSAAPALELAERLDPDRCRLKVGKELFTRAGPAVVEQLQSKGFEVFLDLKFHDIPHTTAAACSAAAELGVWMVNVHASGGRRMMEAAREAIDAGRHRPLLIAVTVLTSMSADELTEIGLFTDPADQVMRLARLAHQSGLDGLVCSAQEAAKLRDEFGAGFKLVTPGVRPAGADSGDQRRIMTPEQALQAGASYLVIGRPITQATDPVAAFEHIQQQIAVSR
ncbi:orotidine 5'-phosphate decarboxylase [Candidatus Tenderia electrophaga]|jgi:orotidine-5'-phosphate decarboxylase|uniref:Orotidine 5'-phosphate decarboxylase n=1 Tax=Candidatus Tenderia electrophaga TaxID=1748243 RepID=A0A0S2THZ8_9GAMM|nr:orotidine 5'-phosphate decarboxylase [Candidatus Tenderia electrophaga]